MIWWHAVFLGIVQGVTEFLPVSSSGHLAIFENFLAMSQATLTFDIMLHLGTLAAVIVFFRKQLLALSKDSLFKIGIATLPIVLAGALLKPIVEALRTDMSALVITYIFTATLLFIADRFLALEKDGQTWTFVEKIHSYVTGKTSPSVLQAFIVGLFQVLAVLPGISRSGTTVAAGAISGIPAETAFSFAFLISIPAVAGAVVLDLLDVVQEGNVMALPWNIYTLGAITSALVGFAALSILKWFVAKRMLWPFSLYCLLVSILLFFVA